MIGRAEGELGCVVVNVLDLHDYDPPTTSTGTAPTAPPVVRSGDVESVGDEGLLQGAHQGEDTGLGVNVERTVREAATWRK